MLCQRWRQALRNRHSGADFKPPLGAVVKYHLWVLWSNTMVLSAERKGRKTGQVSALKLNESEELMKRRQLIKERVKTGDRT